MHFLEYFRAPPRHNLQEGLFQIASQTCNLLVQVNNTNNITFGGDATNIHVGNGPSIRDVQDEIKAIANGTTSRTSTSTSSSRGTLDQSEQLLVLLPPGARGSRGSKGLLAKPRLSTVLEGAPTKYDEEGELWNQGYMLPSDHGSPIKKWGHKNRWCRPSCIPISIICILIFLVVLLPLLDHATEKALQDLNRSPHGSCNNTCQLSLVESIPEGVVFPNSSVTNPSTFDTWLDIINSAQSSIDIASLYWTLRQSEVYPDPSSIKGEVIFQALLKAGTDRRIAIRIAQNQPTEDEPNVDTEYLVKRKAAAVRSLNFSKLMGGGVLHTKLWIVDKKHVYLGSANMDWRSLTQVKEMGILVSNCSCLAEDATKIFEVYWTLGQDDAKVPDHWPPYLQTNFNMITPMNLTYNRVTYQTYLSNSPPPFNPTGRTNDIDALVNVIRHAERFVYIAVMDYIPLMIYTPKVRYWPVIDDALKRAAIENKVQVRLLISYWNHSRHAEDNFLRSIASVSKAYPKVSIEVRRFIVPASKEQQKIPYARVNHNKYMVTDNTAFIGTSNWSGDYFTDTAGVSLVLHDPIYRRYRNESTVRAQLQAVFERDWNSDYAHLMNITD